MVDAFLDTAILVDLLRGYSPAEQWFDNENKKFGITKFVWMEIVAGSQNKQSLNIATKLIQRFELVPITPKDIDWGLAKLIQFNLSHNIDPLDCLIASSAYRLQIPLYTRNLKHFKPLLLTLAQNPY